MRPTLPILAAMLMALPCDAGGSKYIDKDEWFTAVGEVTTILFTEVAPFTWLTDQYEPVGVIFVDGNDQVYCCAKESFPGDGAGVDGNGDILVEFSEPQNWVAVEFPGQIAMQLSRNGRVVYTAGFGDSPSPFAGVIVNEPFDSVLLIDPCCPDAEIDDLHFGAALPGDVNHDLEVNVADLIEVILNWGSCPPPAPIYPPYCPGDLDADGAVGVQDLIAVVLNWD